MGDRGEKEIEAFRFSINPWGVSPDCIHFDIEVIVGGKKYAERKMVNHNAFQSVYRHIITELELSLEQHMKSLLKEPR